jgi:hypothetical protein
VEKISLGETRRDAIDRVQERLGPVTPRPLAEQTFWSLAKQGKITMTEAGVYLIEANVNDEDLRQEATQSITAATQESRSRSRGSMRHFVLNHNSMHKARVGSSWHPINKTVFAPSPPDDEPPKKD